MIIVLSCIERGKGRCCLVTKADLKHLARDKKVKPHSETAAIVAALSFRHY